MTKIAILNPWQTAFAATLASIEVGSDFFVLVYDPRSVSSHNSLRKLNLLTEEIHEDLAGYLPFSLPSLLAELDPAIEASRKDWMGPRTFVTSVKPSFLLVMAEMLPSDSFWHALPENTAIEFVNATQRQELIEDQIQETKSLQERELTTSFTDEPIQLLERAWSSLHAAPLDWSRGIVLCRPEVSSLFTGLYRSLEKGVPLVCVQMVGGDTGDTALMSFKGTGEPDRIVEVFADVQKASLVDAPEFQSVIEEDDSVAYVLALERCLRRNGEAVLAARPAAESVDSAMAAIRGIANLHAYSAHGEVLAQELARLKSLVTETVPRDVREIVESTPNLPVEVVGTAFPYSLCQDGDSEAVWGESRAISFLPRSALLQLLQREYIATKREQNSSKPGLICLIVDALPGLAHKETESLSALLQESGVFTLVLQDDEAEAQFVSAILESFSFDLVFFISHGTEQSLELVNSTITSARARALALFPNPFIVNNSCLSWTGVGQSFVTGSARAFVGTHWTIENGAASDIGVRLVRGLMNGDTAAESLREAIQRSTDQVSALSYVLVGPHDATLTTSVRQATQEGPGWAYARLVASFAQRQSRDLGGLGTKVLQFLNKHRPPSLPNELIAQIKSMEFDCYMQLIDTASAIELDHMIKLGREIVADARAGDEEVSYRTHSHLGTALLRRRKEEDLLEARECFHRAICEERRLGDDVAEAKDLANLGVLEMALGEFREAASLFIQALKLYGAGGSSIDTLYDLQNLALCYAELDEVNNALEQVEEALQYHAILPELRPKRIAWCNWLAAAFLRNSRLTEAERFVKLAMDALKLQPSRDSDQPSASIGLIVRTHEVYVDLLIKKDDPEAAAGALSIISSCYLANDDRLFFATEYRRLTILASIGKTQDCKDGAMRALALLHARKHLVGPTDFSLVEQSFNSLMHGTAPPDSSK